MSETSDVHATCTGFETWLLEAGNAPDPGAWSAHLESCDACARQWLAHTALTAAFAAEPAPRLSPTFRVQLPADLAPVPVRRPLTGWRTVAMLAYSVMAVAALAWALRDVPLPTVDPSSPLLMLVAFLAVPATLGLAIAVSRWLPQRRLTAGPTTFAL